MNDGSDNNGVVISIGLILMLFLLIGGAGIYFLVARQHTALALQADQAHMAEAQARMRAEQARAEANVALASPTTSQDEVLLLSQGNSISAAVEAILRAQEDAWNRGDLDAFVAHYWKSEAVTFSSGGKTTRGWTETLNRYRERYPTREKMGRLTLTELEITPLGDAAALVLGRWIVERDSEPLSGNFSLVVRKFDDRWLIVHDHTSRTME